MKKVILIVVLLGSFFLFPDVYRQVGIFLKEAATLVILGK